MLDYSISYYDRAAPAASRASRSRRAAATSSRSAGGSLAWEEGTLQLGTRENGEEIIV